MSLISLEEQLKLLDEQIQNCDHAEDSDEYKELLSKRTLIYNQISSLNYNIRRSQEYIAEQEIELRRIKREAEEGLLNSGTSKAAQAKREYAKMLVKEIIPRFERDIWSTGIEIHKKKLVLSGVPWPEAIKECQKIRDGVEEEEEELTLF